jgi:hypothetical protein
VIGENKRLLRRKSRVRAVDTAYSGPIVILEEGNPTEYPPAPPTSEHPGPIRRSAAYVAHRFGYAPTGTWDVAKKHTEVQRQYDWVNNRTSPTLVRREYSVVTCKYQSGTSWRFVGIGVVGPTDAFTSKIHLRATENGVTKTTPEYTAVSYDTATATSTMTVSLTWDDATQEFVYSVTGMTSVPANKRAYLFIMPARISGATGTLMTDWLHARTTLVRLVPDTSGSGVPLNTLMNKRTTIGTRTQTGESDSAKTFFGMILLGPEFTETAKWNLLETKQDFSFPSLVAYVNLP